MTGFEQRQRIERQQRENQYNRMPQHRRFENQYKTFRRTQYKDYSGERQERRIRINNDYKNKKQMRIPTPEPKLPVKMVQEQTRINPPPVYDQR